MPRDSSSQQVLIFGASTRAAAHSAVRAGMLPVCSDVFSDLDLLEVAGVIPIDCYPHGLRKAAAAAPDCPWMYTGALENHPRIIESVSAGRQLWGNPADVVRRVRSPQFLFELLNRAELPALEVCQEDSPPVADGGWLLKPVRGAAGRGITLWSRDARSSPTLGEEHYFQKRAAGNTASAVFLAGRYDTQLLGMTRQLVGRPELRATEFAYCGSIGPIDVAPRIRRQMALTGQTIAAGCGLRGLFGIDCVLDERCAWPVEVNPRYTASVEVLELACDATLLDRHRRVFERAAIGLEAPVRRCTVGKAIVYADREMTIPSLHALRGRSAGGIPSLADIPAVGTCIQTGQPVCTVLASGDGVDDCGRRLFEKVRGVDRHFRAGRAGQLQAEGNPPA